ncbi:MAG: zinc dependent phospholipase C family protein [Deltaproteobacteria bacterium]|nr:zinc dependent phospholipase C family protein [Deltaproteobacteria bacterium]
MNRIWSKVIVYSSFLMLFSSQAQAFKVDTHVWVGQQVINDLEDDGKLTFKFLNQSSVEIAVNSDITNAILSNKSDFLMGNIGPDAVPDVVAGQIAVHPGDTDWKTNGWLNYLLGRTSYSDDAKAFVYGYLGHAAADVFSHTYVNQYAGGTFLLTDGEILVEERHFILEGFISKHLPPLKDHTGADLGSPWSQITLDDNFATFARDALIFNDEVQGQYWQNSTAPHLAAYYDYRKAIHDLAEDPIWHEIDMLAVMIVGYFFDISISPDEADKIVNEAQPIIDTFNGTIPDNLQQLDQALFDLSMKYEGKGFAALEHANAELARLENDLLAKKQELDNKLVELALLTIPECCAEVCGPFGIACVDVCEPTCMVLRGQIINQINALNDFIHTLENQLLGIEDDYHDAVRAVRDNAIIAATAGLNIKNAIIDLLQIPYADASPIQATLRYWRDDVDKAMLEYVKATGQTMLNTMDPNASALEPITNWFDCYHKGIIGIPTAISGCEFKDSVAELKNALVNIISIIEEYSTMKNVLGTPGYTELKNLEQQVVDLFVDELKEEAGEQLLSMLPEEVEDIIELIDADPNDATLNLYFTKPESGSYKGLVMIPDMAERVKAEMYLKDGKFDPERYAVAYNAIVLAKLALLDKTQLNELATQAGVDLDEFGGNLFDEVDNAVAVAFENIDADHQWMEDPPPVPNTLGLPFETATSFVSETGFLLWKDKERARDKMFRSLFIGPLSPGIDAPNEIGKAPVISSDYPYKPCFAHPYPDDIYDTTCTDMMSFPVVVVTDGVGQVTSADGMISCGSDCEESYTVNTVVTLTATPGVHYDFTGWEGGGCAGVTPCTVTIDKYQLVRANFTKKIYNLMISKTGSGTGTISSASIGINCGENCSYGYEAENSVTLTAKPDICCEFRGWNVAGCGGLDCSISMNSPLTVSAEFQPATDLVRIKETLMPFNSIQAAYEYAHNAGMTTVTIQSKAVEFAETVDLRWPISVTLEGGYNWNYTVADNVTILNGDINVSNGSANIASFVLQ